MTNNKNIGAIFEEFSKIVRRLRAECPWDREQTHSSLRQHLLEEAYEAVESIQDNHPENLKGELGDLLLHIVLHSIIAEEEKYFTLEDVIHNIQEKMIRRHPHIFSDAKAENAETVVKNWEHIKLAEGKTSVLDGVPKASAALLRATRIQSKASKIGFDWTNKEDVWKKVEEELSELHDAEKNYDIKKKEEEFGDLLFSLVNYSRFIGVDAEASLQHSTQKFFKRFQYIERKIADSGRSISNVHFEELDALWNEAKKES